MASPPSIAIVGAGPAGLTLARLLDVGSKQEGVSLDVQIFEKDASPTSRIAQGGTLDLHPSTGLAAIRAMGLWGEFEKYARYEGEEFCFADKNGTEYVHMKEAVQIDGVEARPEIDRVRLQALLLESVNSDWIRWGKHLRKVTEDGLLSFDDGTTEGPFDLVVGAEGGWSKIAPVLTPVRPTYSGIAGLESNARLTEEYSEISKMVGRGSYFAFSDSKAIMAQRMGDESLKIGTWMRCDENYPAKLVADAGSDEAALKEKILEHYQDWTPEITKCIEISTQFRPWPLYELPLDHSWEHKTGFTLVGDAAHLMCPFAGEGVNTAMRDGLELSGAIIASQKTNVSLDTIIQIFEEEMFHRMHRVQRDTMRNKDSMFFKSNAPIGLMLSFIEAVAEETGRTTGVWYYILPVAKWAAFGYFSMLSIVGRVRRRFRSFGAH